MTQPTERSFKFTVDQADVQKALQTLEKLQAEEKDLAKEILQAGKASDEQAKALKAVQKGQRELSSALKITGADFNQQENEIDAATQALQDYEKQIRATKASGSDFSGDVASSIGGLRGAGDALTGGNLGGAGDVLGVIEGLADLNEFAPNLNTQLDTLGNLFRSGDNAASKLVTDLGDGIAGITGLSAGTASFLTVAAPAALLLGGLALGYNELQKVQQQQIAAIDAEVQARRAVFDLVTAGTTTAEAQAEQERIAEEIARRTSDLYATAQQDYDAFLADTTQTTQDATGILRDLSSQFLGQTNIVSQGLDIIDQAANNFSGGVEFTVQQLNAAEQKYADTVNEEQTAIEELQKRYDELTIGINEGIFAANDLKETEADLTKQREQDVARLQALSAQSLGRADQLESQYTDIVESTALAAKNAAELQAVQSQIDNENAQQRAKDHNKKLEEIEIAGQKRIEQINAELSSLPQKRLADLEKVESEGNDKLKKLQDDYQQGTVEKYKNFTKRLEQSTDDAAKSIARLSRDITNSLNDAQRANDVEAFLKAQRDGEQRLNDAKEDARTQEQRAIQEFIDGREKERQAYIAKQKDIQASIEAERQQVISAYNERRQALADQIDLERKATQERLEQERASFQEQLKRDAIREEQQQRLQAVRDAQQQRAHEARLQEIQAEAQAQQLASSAYLASIQRIQAAAAGISLGGARQESPVFGGSGKGSSNPFGGATVFQQSTHVTVGDIASKKEVEEALRGFADKQAQSNQRVLSSFLFG